MIRLEQWNQLTQSPNGSDKKKEHASPSVLNRQRSNCPMNACLTREITIEGLDPGLCTQQGQGATSNSTNRNVHIPSSPGLLRLACSTHHFKMSSDFRQPLSGNGARTIHCQPLATVPRFPCIALLSPRSAKQALTEAQERLWLKEGLRGERLSDRSHRIV